MKNKNKEVSDINIGMIGFGYIAQGVFSLINEQKDYIAKKINKNLIVKRIAEKDTSKTEAANFPGLEKVEISADAEDVLNDESIDIVVELIGGIDPAFDFIHKALSSGKYVVTANKDLIANRGEELYKAAEDNNVDILFEASVLGGIPIIRPLKTTLAANSIEKIVGIVNGTTNYILTKMEKDGLAFDVALKKAQDLGIAEKANPDSDIEGYDASYKIAILGSIAFNSRIVAGDVYREGITKITTDDMENAAELGYKIKLLAIGTEQDGEISVRVHPALVPLTHILASIENEFNAIYVYGNYVGELMSYGRGAGDKPTASSVVGDIMSIAGSYDRDKKGIIYGCSCFEKKKLLSIDDIMSKFYILMDVADQPGVLARIANVFGENSVSINSMIQKQISRKGSARLVFITHEVSNKNLYKSIKELSGLDVIDEVLSIIRVEDLD